MTKYHASVEFKSDINAEIALRLRVVEDLLTGHVRAGRADLDFYTIASGSDSGTSLHSFAKSAIATNWSICHATVPEFETFAPRMEAITFDLIMPVDDENAFIARGGRPWMNDRNGRFCIAFQDSNLKMTTNARGQVAVRHAAREFHQHGFALAKDAIERAIANGTHAAPVIAAVAGIVSVYELRTFARIF